MNMSAKRLAVNGMLAAVCAVLGYLSLDMGNIKITFESLPILLGAMLFGPVDGLAIGGIGTLIYQLLRYGITVTTPLWMLPYALCGFLTGFYAKRNEFHLSDRQIMRLVAVNELLITLLNTAVIYVDSHIYGYYSQAYVFGSLVVRLGICLVRAAVFGLVLPAVIRALGKTALIQRGNAR